MIERLVVVGSGVMGRGIAYVGAVGGFQTTLVDIKQEQLESAQKEIASIFEQAVVRGKLTTGERQEAEARLSYSLDLAAAVRDADLVIEAVPEKLEMEKASVRDN
ncbi:3-hydroxyadipyl-CoA dehydrogenase [Geobacillus sp. BCO2]|nr:3-hydroxyadipyl-CoA dehydrogenase [Geobacillus sp. BCO2]